MEAKQLKADLSMIGSAVDRADIPKETKALFREVLAWNEALVDQAISPISDGLDAAEAALDELIDGGGEMILPQTAANLTSAFEHGLLLCQATFALLEGPLGASVDEVSKKRFLQLIDNAQRAFAIGSQIVQEITTDEGDDDGDDGDGDGDGTGDVDAGPDGSGSGAVDDEGEDEGEDE